MTTPHKGVTFTHKHFLDPHDRRLPAKQARKAVMVITRVTKYKVFYSYEGENQGRWYMPREYWQETYGANT